MDISFRREYAETGKYIQNEFMQNTLRKTHGGPP